MRRRVAREVEAGVAYCVRCRTLIVPGTEWHLDHNDDGHGWLGPSHAGCNTSAGGRLGRQRQLAQAPERGRAPLAGALVALLV
jgi:hypothetical protein